MSSNIHLPALVASFAAALVISLVIHELGHAVAGRLAGLRVVACGIGYRPWLHIRVDGITFYIGWPFWCGLTLSLEDNLYSHRGRTAVMVAGGPLATLLAFCATGWLWYGHHLLWWAPELCIVNGLLTLSLLIPFSTGSKTLTFRTDALIFAQLCRGTTHTWGDSGVNLGTMLYLRDMFRRLNCRPGVVQTTLGAGLFCALLDDTEQASAFLSDEALQDPDRGQGAVAWEGFSRAVLASVTDAADFPEILAAARRVCDGQTAATISLTLTEAERQHRHGVDARPLAEQAMRAAQDAGLPAQEAQAESFLLQIDAPADLADRCRSLLARRGARCLTREGSLELLTVAARVCAERGDSRGAQEFFAKAVEGIQEIAAHIPTPATRERFFRARGTALRAAAIAGDGVPAFVSESGGPKQLCVNLGRAGLLSFATGLALGAILFVRHLFDGTGGDITVRLTEASSLAVGAMALFGLLGSLFCLLALLQPSASRRLGLYGLLCNFVLILAPAFLMRAAFHHDFAADAKESSLDDLLGASAIHNLRKLAELQFLQGRTEDASVTCRHVMALGRDVHPSSPARARALFSFAELLDKQAKLADAETVCRQAIVAAGESEADVPTKYVQLLTDIRAKAGQRAEQALPVEP